MAEAAAPPAEKVPLHIKLFHGLGSVAYGIKDNGFSTFLLFYYNQVVGLDEWVVTIALVIAMICDAFADPVIGHLSDRTYTRWGRRLPWLYIVAIPLGFAWMLLWAAPVDTGGSAFFYLLATALAVRLLVSAYEVPNSSLIPELTSDYNDRTNIMRFRFLFGWGGGLLMLWLAYAVFLTPDENHPVGLQNADGYWAYGLFGAIVMTAAMLLSAAGQHRRVAHWPASRPAKTSIASSFNEIRQALSYRPAVILFGAALFFYISQGITFTISNYLYVFVWRFSAGALSLYPWLLFVSVIGSFLLVTPLVRRFGKKAVAIATGLSGMLFWVTPFILNLSGIWPPTGGGESTSLVFGFAFCSNLLSVMTMITAQSMVAELVEAAQIETGRRSEGIFSAGWFFTQKFGVGLGIGICGLIIWLSGLPRRADPDMLPAGVIDNIMLSYILLIGLLAIIGAAIFARFPIGREDHEERLRQLAGEGPTAAPRNQGW